MIAIYILQLEDNKYYVGKTKNPDFRIEQHFDSDGSAWTQKYKPIRIVYLIPDCDDFDEDKHTLKMMKQHGIDNVRGGSFCELNLSEDNRKTINKMFESVNNECYNCGSNDHYINDCPNNKNDDEW